MPTRLPPLNALHAFVVTAHHLNLTRAAETLCVTQGAVSRQIATLEQYFGVALFTRKARGLELTQHGKKLLPGLQSAFEMIRQSSEQLARDNQVIRMKSPTCAMRWLVPRLIELEQAMNELHVSLSTTAAHTVDFRSESFDAAVIFAEHPQDADYEFQYKLFDEELVAVMSPQLMPVPAKLNLQNLTLLHPTQDGRDWKLWIDSQEEAGIHNRSTTAIRHQHFDTMDLAISAAIQGFGVAMADRSLVAEDIRMHRLVCAAPHSVKTGAAYYLVHPHSLVNTSSLERMVLWFCQQVQIKNEPSDSQL